MSNLPQIQGSRNMQNLLSLNPNSNLQKIEVVKPRNLRGVQSKNMAEILGGNEEFMKFQRTQQNQNFQRRSGDKFYRNINQNSQNQSKNQDYEKMVESSPSELQQQQQLDQQQKNLQLQQLQSQVNQYNNRNNNNNSQNNSYNNESDQHQQFNQQNQYNQQNQQNQYNRPQSQSNLQQSSSQGQNLNLNQNFHSQQNYEKLKQMRDVQDLEMKERVQQQDRVVTYLIEQINQLEKSVQGELRKAKVQIDYEKEYRSRIESNLRVVQDQVSSMTHDTTAKLDYLTNKQSKEEKQKSDIEHKLQVQEQNQKEILFFIRNMQKSETGEILSMRDIMQKKITEDQKAQQIEREKSKALFLEMVRLGETNEKLSAQVSKLQSQIDSKVQTIESKISLGENNLNQISQKGESGLNFINEQSDKIEKRLQQLELNILQLGKEQLMDKDNINRLDFNDVKLSEDVKQLLTTLHKDYQQRLDTKTLDLINRLSMEHEERVRQLDDFKSAQEAKERMLNEKYLYEKEEMRERYSSLEMLMRTELQRKDEALKSIQSIFENQIRSLQNALKEEEQQRYNQEQQFRQEIAKISEQFNYEHDLFKNQQSSLTEKITEMMKIEIQTRLSSDVDLKNLTSAIAQDLVQDLNQFKENVQIQNQKFQQDLKDVNSESSLKAQQLSRYIDEENKKIAEAFGIKYDKMKNIFTKLAEQFKNHLINTDINRKEIERQILQNEENLDEFKAESYQLLNDTQKTFESRLQEEKNNINLQMDSKLTTQEDKVYKLEEELNKDVEILKQSIDANRQQFTEQMTNLLQQNQTFHQLNEDNMQKIVDATKIVDEQIEKLEESQQEKFKNLEQKIDENQKQNDQALSDQLKQINENKRNLEEQIQQNQKALNENIQSTKEKLAELIKHDNDLHTQLDIKLTELDKLIKTNFDIASTTAQSLEELQKQHEQSIITLTNEMYTDNLFSKSENQEMTQNIQDLLKIQQNQQEELKLNHLHYNKQFESITKDLSTTKEKILNEIQENYDAKISNIFSNLKMEQQQVWDTNIQNIDSLFKNGKFTDKENVPMAQLNEILLTQDVYQKPQIKYQ